MPAATDDFSQYAPGLTAPADDTFTITKSDSVDLPHTTRGIYAGVGGDITVVTKKGTTQLFSAVPAGSILPVRATRVMSTGTTASAMVGMY